MIQRVQTLYLLLTAILVGILQFTPLAVFNGPDSVSLLSAWSIQITEINGSILIIPRYALGITMSVTALLPLITLFLYRNRRLQMRLCLVEILLVLASIGIFICTYMQQNNSNLEATPSPQSLLLLVAILPVLAARRRIAKDEALVRSLDRIR